MANATYDIEACYALSKSERVKMAIIAARQIITSGDLSGGAEKIIVERSYPDENSVTIKAKYDWDAHLALTRLRKEGWRCSKTEAVKDPFGGDAYWTLKATPPDTMKFFDSEVFANADETFMSAIQKFVEFDVLKTNLNNQHEITVACEVLVMVGKQKTRRTTNLALKRLADFNHDDDFLAKYGIERMIGVMMNVAEESPHLMRFNVIYGTYKNIIGYEDICRRIAMHLVPSALAVSSTKVFNAKTANLAQACSLADTALYRSLDVTIKQDRGL